MTPSGQPFFVSDRVDAAGAGGPGPKAATTMAARPTAAAAVGGR